MSIDYESAVENLGPGHNQVTHLAQLAEEQIALAARLAELQDELARVQADYKKISEVTIPDAMSEAGVSHLTLDQTGHEIDVQNRYYATITEANRESACDWLEQHEEGGMVKYEASVVLGKGDKDGLEALSSYCKERDLSVKAKRTVHPQTLKAWFRRMCETEQQHMIPEDLFSVYSQKVASISKAD